VISLLILKFVFFLAENKFEIRISPDLIKMAETISNDKKSKTTVSAEGRFNRSQDIFGEIG